MRIVEKEAFLMAVSKAQQKAVNKYMAANYDRINLTVPKGRKDEIQAFAAQTGESVNGFINRAIGEAMGDSTQQPAGAPQGEGAILTPAALKTAQEAAQRAGETVPAFVSRAVDIQSKRDKIMQGLKTTQEEGE